MSPCQVAKEKQKKKKFPEGFQLRRRRRRGRERREERGKEGSRQKAKAARNRRRRNHQAAKERTPTWNKVTDCFRKYGVWFSDGKDLDEYLAKKDNERIDEEVNRRLEEQGKGKDKSSGSKGKGWENSDSWWNTDDSGGYENTGYENNW